MKIASSQLQMSSSHAGRRQHEVRESLRAEDGRAGTLQQIDLTV